MKNDKYAEYCRENPTEKIVYKDFEAGYDRAMEEVLIYLFNTGNHLDNSEDYYISPKYLTQTIKYLKQQKLED